jgi:hypothetical protein
MNYDTFNTYESDNTDNLDNINVYRANRRQRRNRTNRNNRDINRNSINMNGPDRNIIFNEDQIFILDMYISQYNEQSRQINERYRELNAIRTLINNIVNRAYNSYYNNLYSSQHLPYTNRHYYDTNVDVSLNTYNQYGETGETGETRQNNTDNSAWNNMLNSFFTRVPIIPSRTQIDNSTQTLSYSNIINPINESCPILLERFQPTDMVTQIRECGHIFTPCEIASWFQSNVGCPVCRYDIRNYSNREETKEETNAEETKVPDINLPGTLPTNSENSHNGQHIHDNNIYNEISNLIINTITGNTTQDTLLGSQITRPTFTYDASSNLYIIETFLRNYNNFR